MKTVLADATQMVVSVNNTDGAYFEFPCSGRADDSTPVTVKWYHEEDEVYVRVEVVPNQRMVAANGSLILQLDKNDTQRWADYRGLYQCRADNGYSQAIREVVVIVVDYIPPRT